MSGISKAVLQAAHKDLLMNSEKLKRGYYLILNLRLQRNYIKGSY